MQQAVTMGPVHHPCECQLQTFFDLLLSMNKHQPRCRQCLTTAMQYALHECLGPGVDGCSQLQSSQPCQHADSDVEDSSA